MRVYCYRGSTLGGSTLWGSTVQRVYLMSVYCTEGLPHERPLFFILQQRQQQPKVQQGPLCDLCTLVASFLKPYVDSNSTECVSNVCSFRSGHHMFWKLTNKYQGFPLGGGCRFLNFVGGGGGGCMRCSW